MMPYVVLDVGWASEQYLSYWNNTGVSTPQYDLNWVMYSYIEMSYVTDIGSKKSCYPTQQVGDHTLK